MANSSGAGPEAARVTDRIRDEILDGVRAPGSKLVERELADELGVSRVPVREALKALVAEGLVTLRPRTWAVVREFTSSDVADFTEVRGAFETLAFRLAAQRHSREGLQKLRTVLDAEFAAAEAGDAVAARRAAADFHEVVTELAGNRLLEEIGQITRSRMRWYLGQHDDLVGVARQHADLFDAIARRDLAEVERQAADHLKTSMLLQQEHASRTAPEGEPTELSRAPALTHDTDDTVWYTVSSPIHADSPHSSVRRVTSLAATCPILVYHLAMEKENLLVTNVRPWGADAVDVVITGDTITEVRPATPDAAPATETTTVVDGGGKLALPGFINAHAHVDKSWWGQPWVSYGGEATTQGRIAHERAQRDKYGIPSAHGTERVLREFLRHGTTATRTHVDVDLGVGLDGITNVRTAADRLGGAVEVEIVAFPQDGVIRRDGVLKLLDAAADAGAHSIGGIDPCAIDRDPVAQLDGLFEIAERRGCGIDIHLHSGGDLAAFEYELIIDRTRRAGLAGKVNVSHGFGLGQLTADRQTALVEQFGELGISWTTVAPTGSAPLPWRTMLDRGMGLGLGTDGIRDLWSPYGDGDILQVALDFAKLHRVRYDEDFVAVARLATSSAAGFVHRSVHDVTVGARADLVLVDAENVPDAIVRAPRRDLVIAGGCVVASDGEVTV